MFINIRGKGCKTLAISVNETTATKRLWPYLPLKLLGNPTRLRAKWIGGVHNYNNMFCGADGCKRVRGVYNHDVSVYAPAAIVRITFFSTISNDS